MKKALALVIVLLCGGGALAAAGADADAVVTWRDFAGVITAPNVDNPVAVISDQQGHVTSKISSGTLPWTTRTGSAHVDLSTGRVQFSIRGLVLVGGNGSGTAGPINQVVGTLVCNPGSTDTAAPQAILDTAPVTLSTLGNANFSGELTSIVPQTCGNPLFLIRIGPSFGAFAGRWLATGLAPHLGSDSEDARAR
jgi:hypothetical protein